MPTYTRYLNPALLLSLMALLAGPARAAGPIAAEEVAAAQQQWGACIVAIGQVADDAPGARNVAASCIDTLYAYDLGGVLFKPTKAAAQQFRLTRPEALSYFVTGIIAEDHGFALQPWNRVRFDNVRIITDSDSAVAMGNYYFTDARTGKEVKVEYTFGYIRDAQGRLRINLHHSSLPYQPGP